MIQRSGGRPKSIVLILSLTGISPEEVSKFRERIIGCRHTCGSRHPQRKPVQLSPPYSEVYQEYPKETDEYIR